MIQEGREFELYKYRTIEEESVLYSRKLMRHYRYQ